MSLGLAFYIIMLIWFVFALAWNYGWVAGPNGPLGNSVLLFVLFLLLGWHAFGPPIRG